VSDDSVTAYTPKVVPEENWMTLADAMKLKEQAWTAGRTSMKAEILAMLSTCLDRDPSLQKLVQQVEGME
jgi:hypothetical protein